MQKILITVLTPFALLAALPAYAQTLADQLLPEPSTMLAQAGSALEDLPRDMLRMLGDTDQLFAHREMAGSRVVKGAPYCADAVNENVQTLADGNRIVKKSTTRWCRDAEGRTRQETERGERKVVYLRDPVAGKSWSLDPQNKTATQIGSVVSGESWSTHHDAHDAMRDYAARMREWARSMAQRMRQGVPDRTSGGKSDIDPVAITQVTKDAPEGKGSQRSEVYVFRMNGDEPMPVPPAPPVGAVPMPPPSNLLPPLNVRMFAPRGKGVQTSLGSKEFDGVKANGEKTTWTIEAGKYGNEKPIVIISEKWTSPDLMLTVYARDFDPRSGEVVYRLVNLKRGEPDAALFKVPSEFKVREAKSFSLRFGPPASSPSAPPREPAERGE